LTDVTAHETLRFWFEREIRVVIIGRPPRNPKRAMIGARGRPRVFMQRIHPVMEELRRARVNCDMTQKQLGEALGVSAMSVGNWECGRATPDLGVVVTIANYFGYDLRVVPK